jgi:hypothetical protein
VVRYDSRDEAPAARWERGGDGPPRGYGSDQGFAADGGFGAPVDEPRGGWNSPGRSEADPSWRRDDRFAEPVAGSFPDRRPAADDDLADRNGDWRAAPGERPASATPRPRRGPDTDDPWADG